MLGPICHALQPNASARGPVSSSPACKTCDWIKAQLLNLQSTFNPRTSGIRGETCPNGLLGNSIAYSNRKQKLATFGPKPGVAMATISKVYGWCAGLFQLDGVFGNRTVPIASAVYFTSENMRLVFEVLLVRNDCRGDTEAWKCLERWQLDRTVVIMERGPRSEHQNVHLVILEA